MLKLVLLSILQSALLCGGQVMLKLAVLSMDKTQSKWDFFVHSLFLNWQLACCGVLFTGAGLLWMYILRHFPLSNAYPLTALSFVFGMLAAMWVFHESINYWQWAGIALILVGCYFLTK